jgi:hypothetical protein
MGDVRKKFSTDLVFGSFFDSLRMSSTGIWMRTLKPARKGSSEKLTLNRKTEG